VKQSHKENIVSPWAEQKLQALEAYLQFYTTALKKQSFTLVYVDAFAGSPRSKVRGPEVAPDTSPFFDDEEIQIEQEKFIEGSPLRALKHDGQFSQFHFFDLDETRAQVLKDVSVNNPRVEVKVGDCNPLIRSLAPRLKAKHIRGVAFLDPYGAHLEWTTVEALAATGTMEVIINFPVAMAINRLITRSGEIPETWTEQLNGCFGSDIWRNIASAAETDLFGETVVTKRGDVPSRLLDQYMAQLKTLFPCVATPRLIRNTRGSPLYYLLWAGPNRLGLKGADYILSQGEKVKRSRTKN